MRLLAPALRAGVANAAKHVSVVCCGDHRLLCESNLVSP